MSYCLQHQCGIPSYTMSLCLLVHCRVTPSFREPQVTAEHIHDCLGGGGGAVPTCSAGEVRRVEPSVAAVEPSSSEAGAEAVVSE